MKTKAFGIFLLLWALIAAAAETRPFVLNSGVKMEGEIISVGTDSVKIKKSADGKIYTLPLAYLSESNRLDILAIRAQQWPLIEVLRLEGTASAGRYKRCLVHGTNVSDVILIQSLPPSVEAILNSRNQQAAQIAALSDRVENREWTVQRADATTPSTATGDPDYVNYIMAQRARVNLAIVDLNQAKSNLGKMQQAYSDYLDRTRADTILPMKNTGLVYQGLQVWECADPRKPE